jgi:hypothetical protein
MNYTSSTSTKNKKKLVEEYSTTKINILVSPNNTKMNDYQRIQMFNLAQEWAREKQQIKE